ncbi:MAG: DUF2264 domain-containing protein [Rikenellaceae bacterium]
MRRLLFQCLLLILSVGTLSAKPSAKPSEAEQVRAIITKVNDYWQAKKKPEDTFFWHVAAYHTGNMEAYKLTGEKRYLDYSLAWAEHNKWSGSEGTNKSKWLYKYGRTPDHVLFGDNQICFQTYADLYNIFGDGKMIKRAREVMEHQMSTPRKDYWWWSDGLYMVMPVMTKYFKITNDEKYLDKLYEYIQHSDEIMFDKDENLYYRDAKYVYPKHKSDNGKKDFWARGDGWVLAGLAKVLQDMPKDYKHRSFFVKRFQDMSKALIALQQRGGYWSRSMMDEAHAPGAETSGTAFFTYGLMWGVNNHLLDKATYMPAINKAWRYLSTVALQKDGLVGFVQPIGEKAIPGQVVSEKSTQNFGVGAFLLAACEYVRYLESGDKDSDRAYWAKLAYEMAAPVLKNMAEGKLSTNMEVEVGADWGKKSKRIAYIECFGRLMSGIAPWLTLPDDDTEEGKMRKQLREWALKSYANAVDPENPDYLVWNTGHVTVDGAYVAESLLRGYDALWLPLDEVTKQRYLELFAYQRKNDPPYTNWLLFSSTMEAFIAKAGGEFDKYRTSMAIRKVDEWYVGDGWYADGQGGLCFDYYNSYVIHPMYLETLEVLRKMKIWSNLKYEPYYKNALKRTQRYAMILERLISPEGTFPVFGRSITYRMGAMQPLAMLAWYDRLPATVSRAQVRSALTAVMHKMFDEGDVYNDKGFLSLGFTSKSQMEVVNHYTNNGSLYMNSLTFMPLALPASHPFWTDAPQPWTSKKAWEGLPFPEDHTWH